MAAPGVLANDTDADGDLLTAALVTGPAHGAVTLNANGSFIYTPAAGFVGTDTFTYVANDKASDSAPATVSVAVAAPPQVKSVVFNDGSAQRSEIRSITITFDSLVTFDLGAFRVVRSTGRGDRDEGGDPGERRDSGGADVQRGGDLGRSLADGSWTLKVFRGRVHRADYRPQVMEADAVTPFHRLYGDADGDGTGTRRTRRRSRRRRADGRRADDVRLQPGRADQRDGADAVQPAAGLRRRSAPSPRPYGRGLSYDPSHFPSSPTRPGGPGNFANLVLRADDFAADEG